jgi:homoserine kinase
MRARAPATTANLGPGFDALGLALGLWNEAWARPAERWSIEVEGEGLGTLPTDASNLVLAAVRAVERAFGREAPPHAVRCLNRIPLARGLGSSAAAAALGGVIGAAALGVEAEPERLLAALLPLEGHPDNLAACLLGGFTAAGVDARGAPVARRLPLGFAGPVAVIVPAFTVPTREARAALPATYARADVVANLQREALVIAALAADDRAPLATALDDRIHQPYRRKLYPGIEAVEAEARRQGAAGLCVSGAGPTLLAFPAPGQDATALATVLAGAWGGAGIDARGLALAIEARGAAAEADDALPRGLKPEACGLRPEA